MLQTQHSVFDIGWAMLNNTGKITTTSVITQLKSGNTY